MRKQMRTHLSTGLLLLAVIVLGFIVFRDPSPSESIGLPVPEGGGIPRIDTSTLPGIPPIQPVLYTYIEVIDSCGPQYQGTCVNVRSGPGVEYPTIHKLRTGTVLKVAGVTTDTEGRDWYQIAFEDYIRYPERITSPWYVYASAVSEFKNDGEHWLEKGEHPVTAKHITVDLSERMLYAYDGEALFMRQAISPGLELTPTPMGTFTVFALTPSRYMQGPIPGISTEYYDLPGVPWNLYFTHDGAVIHGAYWHDRFGEPWSHGCVNLPLASAKKLYQWADLGMQVTVQP